MNTLSDFIQPCEEHENIVISYFIKNNSAIVKVPYEHFTFFYCKTIYKAILEINNKGLVLTKELLQEFCSSQIPEFNVETFNQFFIERDFSNIDYYIFKIKEIYFKKKLSIELDKVIGSFIINKKDVNINLLKDVIGNIQSHAINIEGTNQLLDTEAIGNFYRDILKNRRKKAITRSMGNPDIDKKLLRPANPGEMGILFGMKGGLKSTFVKNWENYLINSGICVLSFNPEMEAETNFDRLISMRAKIDIKDLVRHDKNRELLGKIESAIKSLEENPYYIYNSDADLNFDKVDHYITQAKQIFRERGVLPADEYIWTSFDTFDMLSEFDDADPKKIKGNVNKFHRLIRRQRVFALLLLQANENKIRGGIKFKKPEDLEYYKLGKEDIEGGAAYASKARVVFAINRPNYLKKEFFPERMDEWELEPDIINIHTPKLNDGDPFFLQFARGDYYKISSYKPDYGKQDND